MLISNTYIEGIIELRMDNTVLDIVNTHKHLGVILSSNNKWSSHIDSIIKSASKQISFLRKIKCKFSKETLNKLYCSSDPYSSMHRKFGMNVTKEIVTD